MKPTEFRILKESRSSLRIRMFRIITLLGAAGPVVAILAPQFLYQNQSTSLLVLGTISPILYLLNYALYSATKKIELATQIVTFIIFGTFTVATFLAGGLDSEMAFFFPLIPVLIAFVSGAFAAVAATAGLICLTIVLVICEQHDLLVSPNLALSLNQIAVNISLCLLLVGGGVAFFEYSRQRNARILAAQASEMQKLIDGVPAVISHWDAHLKNLAANKGYTDFFGKTPSEILGMSYQDVVGPVFSQIKPFIDKALAGETSSTLTEIVNQNGETRNFQVTFQPDIEKGQLKGIFTIAVDITEDVRNRKLLELERAKSLKTAKLASLGEMSAGVAHEINNPLAIISGSIELLPRLVNEPEKFDVKMDAIRRSVERITKIVSGLRKFSRTNNQSIRETRDLFQIINEALILTESKSKRDHVPVTIDCRTHALIKCDEIEMEQVLINLINNGIDAAKLSSDRWVKISVLEDNGFVVLQVTDSGPGLPDHVRNKLFEPFFTTKKVGEGTGLGLSIVKGILDDHGATINALSDVPNTCFEIRFLKAINEKTA